MKALVTGGNGFVGAHICSRLAASGAHVRALVRAGSDRRLLDGMDVEICEGDVLDVASLDRAMEGREGVFHTAALVRFFVRDRCAMWQTNVDGTRNVVEAARRAGVERLVHTSTVGVFKPKGDSICDERTVPTAKDMIGVYEKSKLEAERIVLEAASDGVPAVICNPSAPVGPGDYKPSPIGKVIVHFLKGKIPGYTDSGLNLVDVRDVAEGHALAAEHGRVGERYILSGENFSVAHFFGLLSEISGVRQPGIRVPYGVALTIGLLGELAGRLTGQEPLACLASVRTSKRPHYCASDKARRELGYAPRPVRESLTEEVAWFRNQGFV